MSRTPPQTLGSTFKPGFSSYKSKFAPAYSIQPNLYGISAGRAMKYLPMATMFTAATGIFALYFFSEVPRVRKDIIEKIPIIGSYFHKEIPPEDNPF